MNLIPMSDIFKKEFPSVTGPRRPNDAFRDVPTGTFGVETWTGIHGTEIVELCEVPLAWLRPSESPNMHVVAQYAEWMQAGHEPPPIHIIQTEKGTLRITNGHHRFAAAQVAGKPTIRAWVSWLMWADGHPTGLTLEAITEAAA